MNSWWTSSPRWRDSSELSNDTAALARYASGKWSVKEVLGHLTDAERIFSYRLLRIGRGDATSLSSLLAEFRTVRLSSLALVGGIPSPAWFERGTASGKPITVRALAYILVGHVAHHLGVLRDRYGLGARPAPASTAENR